MAPKGLGLSDPQRSQLPGRRSGDLSDGGSLAGAPWQVRAVAFVGVPSVIAIGLVWFLAGNVTAALGEVKANTAPIAAHAEASKALGTTLERLEQDHRDSNRRLERLLEIMCWQQARSDAQRQACLERR